MRIFFKIFIPVMVLAAVVSVLLVPVYLTKNERAFINETSGSETFSTHALILSTRESAITKSTYSTTKTL